MMLSGITFYCLYIIERTTYIKTGIILYLNMLSLCLNFTWLFLYGWELAWEPFINSRKLADCYKTIELLFHFKGLTGCLKEAVEGVGRGCCWHLMYNCSVQTGMCSNHIYRPGRITSSHAVVHWQSISAVNVVILMQRPLEGKWSVLYS